MMNEPNVVQGEVVPGISPASAKAIAMQPVGPIPPGGQKMTFVALEHFAADVVGVGSPPGASVVKCKIGQHEFAATEAAGVSDQLAAMRPRCQRAQFVYVYVRNDTDQVQVFQPFFFVENEDASARPVTDRAAKVAQAPNGSTIKGRVPRAQPAQVAGQAGRKLDRTPTTKIIPGATITSIPGPGRHHIAPVTIARKGRHSPVTVAPAGFDHRATELVLFFLERRHLVASQMVPYVLTKFGKIREAVGEEAATLETAIRTRTPILPEERAKAIAAKIRVAMAATKEALSNGDGDGEKSEETEKTE